MIAIAALSLSACTSSDPSVASVDTATIDEGLAGEIDAAIESAMKQSGSTEAVLGVWGSDGNSYVRGYGESGVDSGARIRAAQASQPVMCALLLDLVAAGKADLDRKVTEDLTRQAGIDDVTYRQLCDMKSGIADYKKRLAPIFANNPTRFWPEQELIAQGLAGSPLSWPGLDVHVSDTNAVLLARALRVVTGEDMENLLDNHVFSKAGMGDSYYPNLESNVIPGDTLTGLTYPKNGNKVVCDAGVTEVTEVSPSMLSGAGATVTTVTELKSFYEHYLDGTFGGNQAGVVTETAPLKNPARKKSGTPKSEPDTAGNQWAFGMEKVGPLYGRAGAITGTLTAAFHDPESGYSVVVALNNSTAGETFAEALALQLAALSSEAGIAPEVNWSAAKQEKRLAKRAVCDSQEVVIAGTDEEAKKEE
ncbi:MAG: serine hydrolase domain-containing protein [Leucobacter sp.]